jgi:hypothetical protein
VGTILKPGETFYVALEKQTWSSYETSFTFYGCFDESCGPSSPTTDKAWTVRLYQGRQFFGRDQTVCRGTAGWCSNRDGLGINSGQGDKGAVNNYVVNLIDTRAPDGGRPDDNNV